jgi:uncharacterized SAM-binding protein YcdF (DUF218 family)
VALALGLTAGLLYLGRASLLRRAGRFLDVSEPPRPVDCVMVLGGGSQTRPFVAAALLKAGLARRVLLPAVKATGDNQDGISPPEQEVMKAVLVRQGVGPEAITVLKGDCASTYDEACALARFLEGEPSCSVTVVPSCYQTRRARLVFRKVLGDRFGQVHWVGAPTDGYDSTNWWLFEEGFRTYLDEYLKLAFYELCY